MAGKMFGGWRKGAADERDAGRSASPRPGTASTATEARRRLFELSQQGKDLFGNREFTAAIPVLEEAIDGLRRSSVPDRFGHDTLLGINLWMLGSCLYKTTSTRQALAAAEEAVAILTPVPQAHLSLIGSLEVVVWSLDALSERPEDKIAAAVRAATLLAQVDSPESGYLVRRHNMLNLAATALISSGEIREAIRLRKEAISVAEAAAEADPVQAPWSTVHHSMLAVLHAKVGEFVEACAALEVCETAMSDTAFSAPPGARLSIAWNLTALGRQMVDQGHRGEARRPFALAIETYRGLRADTPEPVEAKLAYWLNEHAWNLCFLGEHDEALPCAEEAVAALRPLVATDPAKRRSYSSCLGTLATALALAGRTDEALTACREALEIRRELAAVEPEKYQDILAWTERQLAKISGRESGSLTEL